MTVQHARNQYRPSEIIKLMGKAGWEARNGAGSHTILTKPGRPNITFGPTIKDSTIKNIKRELGVHVNEILKPRKGQLVKRDIVRDRIIQAQKMRRAGFDMAYVDRACKLNAFHRYGFPSKILMAGEPETLANDIYKEMSNKNGVRIVHAPSTMPTEAEKIVKQLHLRPPEDLQSGDQGAILEILSELERKIIGEFGSSRLLARYQERLKRTLVDARTMRQGLATALAAAERIVAYLEE